MNLTAVKETLRVFWNRINPFYRNPIVDYLNPYHLNDADRQPLTNPRLAQMFIRSILATNRDVRDAVQEYPQGEYVIETAVMGTILRALVYRISAYDEDIAPHEIYLEDWPAQNLPCFTLKVIPERASLTELVADAPECFYDTLNPIQAWSIPLTVVQLHRLGIWKLLH